MRERERERERERHRETGECERRRGDAPRAGEQEEREREDRARERKQRERERALKQRKDFRACFPFLFFCFYIVHFSLSPLSLSPSHSPSLRTITVNSAAGGTGLAAVTSASTPRAERAPLTTPACSRSVVAAATAAASAGAASRCCPAAAAAAAPAADAASAPPFSPCFPEREGEDVAAAEAEATSAERLASLRNAASRSTNVPRWLVRSASTCLPNARLQISLQACLTASRVEGCRIPSRRREARSARARPMR